MKRAGVGGFLLVAALFLGWNAIFVVDQSEQAIVVQFGEPVGEAISEPGLHFKTPFTQDVRRFDRRLLAWDGDISQIPTLGREFVIVDTTARWRIADPLQFLRSVRDEAGARTRLDDIIDSVARDIVSGTHLEEIVRSRDWDVNDASVDPDAAVPADVALDKPKKGRERLEQEMLAAAAKQMPELGIELVDVRIKRINYIDSVRRQVESRMISNGKALPNASVPKVRARVRRFSVRWSVNCARSVLRRNVRLPKYAAGPMPKPPAFTVKATVPTRSSTLSCGPWRAIAVWAKTPP